MWRSYPLLLWISLVDRPVVGVRERFVCVVAVDKCR
jgi:hypothetical protein